MFSSYKDVLSYIQSNEIKIVNFKFTDMRGKCYTVAHSTYTLTEDVLKTGISFDGSSIAGWKTIECSDMLLIPDISSTFADPFTSQLTLNIFCNVYDPITQGYYNLDPRFTSQRAKEYLLSSKIADKVYFGPEIEFFIFDSVQFMLDKYKSYHKLVLQESPHTKHGHYVQTNQGYMRDMPVDHLHDIRSEILNVIYECNMQPKIHHHEVATSQCEIGIVYDEILNSADNVQKCKYIINNVAASYGKSATFMPKPLYGDNGSGMHCHQSLWIDGENIFANNGKLSKECLYYIGGIIKHARAINAFTNPTTNSYKRLVPGYEAPTVLAYSRYNRSAAIRIPYNTTTDNSATRIEVRFPDCTANPYYCFAALLMAGIDGIENQIDPGEETNDNLYTTQHKFPTLVPSLLHALEALDKDRDFLTKGDVFTDEQIDAYIKLKHDELDVLNKYPHPGEFINYYSS